MVIVNDSGEKWTLWTSIVVSAVAVAALVAHLAVPSLKIDFVTVTLLAVACLPWLRGIVSSVELPGGASIKLAARQRVVARAQQETIEAVSVVATADQAVPPDERLSKVYGLADRYEWIRATMSSGQPRNLAMAVVARQILSYMPLNPYEAESDLLSPKAGHRLVAYLSMVASPGAGQAEDLINTLTEREGIPYNQSWALNALNRIVDNSDAQSISSKSLAKLRGMRDGLKPGLDRQLLLADLVDKLS